MASDGCNCKKCKFCGHWEENGYDNDGGFTCYECGNANAYCPVCNIPIRPRNAIAEAERHEKCIATMQLSFLANQYTYESVVMEEKRFWELYWGENRECTKCGLKFKSKKYTDCYNCRGKKPKKRLFKADFPDINFELMLAICAKLEINPNPIIGKYYKTLQEQMELNGLKYDPKEDGL